MKLIIILLTLIFSFASFTSSLTFTTSSNVLNSYFLNTVHFAGGHLIAFIILFIIIALIIFKSLKFEKKHSPKNYILTVITQAGFVFIIGVFSSFILLIIIAILELNFLAYMIDLSPKLLGIQTNIGEIKESLIKYNHAPKLIAGNNGSYEQLKSVALATTGVNNFYGKYILPAIPNLLILPTGNIGSTILMDNTLIFSGINNTELEQISPVVTYLFVKQYFSDRKIKHFPNISILSNQEHLQFRRDDFTKKIYEIEQQATNMQKLISSTSAIIQKNEFDINANRNILKELYSKKNTVLSKCKAEGFYDNSGRYIRKNTNEYCEKLVFKFNEDLQTTDNNIESNTKDLQDNKKLIETYNTYYNFFKAQSGLTGSLKKHIPNELGLFVPENSIKIIINPKNTHAIADYFETVAHEYLHYASYSKNKGLKLIFFEEGLTEFFARKSIENSLSTDTNMGFPVFVKILKQITKLIPESEMADIYFNKDEAALEKSINRVYGDNFYRDSVFLFQAIPYASNQKDLLSFANKLMEKIHGESLNENDLLSNSSSF